MNFIKTKSFCASKDYCENEKPIHRTGQNVCKSRYLIRSEYVEYIKQPLKLKTKRANSPI